MNSINDTTLKLVKQFEGFSANPYQDIAGVWTIGYGETQDIDANTSPVTEDEAETNLVLRLNQFGDKILQIVHTPLNDNQFGAIVSLCYNVGLAPLQGTLGKLLNNGDLNNAANEFVKWCHANVNGEEIVVKGLLQRRQEEKNLFLTPD